MQTTSHRNSSPKNSRHSEEDAPKKKVSFQKVNYDVSDLPPDAGVGAYVCKLSEFKVQGTNKDKFPMIILEWKIIAAEDEENERFKGSTVSDFITFFPPEKARSGRMSKLQLRDLLDQLDLDYDIVPKEINSEEDFNDLKAALKETEEVKVWITHEDDKKTGDTRCKAHYKEVGGASAMAPLDSTKDDEDEDEDDRPKTKKGSATVKKGGVQRR